MRIYRQFIEAYKEIERDLVEMGVVVHPETMQDLQVKDNPDYVTKEIVGYTYCVTSQDILDTYQFMGEMKLNKAYIFAESHDRTTNPPVNPGNSWEHRRDVWGKFLRNGKFSYTYSERIAPMFNKVLMELKERPNSRQIIIPIYHPVDNLKWGGRERVPCSMYYQFLVRGGYLNLIYTMRSCDLYAHFCYDVVLARMLQQEVAAFLGYELGHFTHFIGSLHIYKKDWDKGVF